VQCLVEVHWKLFKSVLKCLECSGLDSDLRTFSSLTWVPQWIWPDAEIVTQYVDKYLLLIILGQSFFCCYFWLSDQTRPLWPSVANAVPFTDKGQSFLPGFQQAFIGTLGREMVTQSVPMQAFCNPPSLISIFGFGWIVFKSSPFTSYHSVLFDIIGSSFNYPKLWI